jgi:hypothetical protein
LLPVIMLLLELLAHPEPMTAAAPSSAVANIEAKRCMPPSERGTVVDVT